MSSVHTVRPTDFVALVSFDGRVYPNEAVTRDRIGVEASPRPLEAALEQWFSFATGRHTWISVKGATLRGLVSARKRGSSVAWEVCCLIDAAEDDPDVLVSLLERLTDDAGRARAEKVFLRVPADSRVVKAACRCGFTMYLKERLMAVQGGGAAQSGQEGADGATTDQGLRSWGREDAYGAYQLYNKWTPEPVRRMEAATFREWTAARERVSPPRGARQRVCEKDGRLVGWLRFAADGELGRFDVMADPSTPEVVDQLVSEARYRLREQQALFTLVPEFAEGLGGRLQERGFAEQAEYAVLVCQTTRPVRLRELAPAAPAQPSSS